jgi:hypothetical protein
VGYISFKPKGLVGEGRRPFPPLMISKSVLVIRQISLSSKEVNMRKVQKRTTQSEIQKLLDNRVEACRTKDVDRLMSLYSPTFQERR